MMHNISGPGLVQEFNRRKIPPDEVTAVKQGTLRQWRYCQSRVAELYVGSVDGKLKPGMVVIADGAYINTYSPQEIADDLTKGKELDIVMLTGNVDPAFIISAAAALGRKGGQVKSDRKTAACRENAKKGGRPTEKKTYWILSGEGEEGTWSRHIATLTGIKRIAARERCNGDRWARIWGEIPETETTKAYIYDIDNGDMRDIPDED